MAEGPLRFELPHARIHVAPEAISGGLHVAPACNPLGGHWLPVLLDRAVARDVHAPGVHGHVGDSAPVLHAPGVDS